MKARISICERPKYHTKTAFEPHFSSSQSVKTTVAPKVHEDIDIYCLRNDKKLGKSVQRELQSLGLKITSLSSDSSDSSSDSCLVAIVTVTLALLILVPINRRRRRRIRRSI